MIALIHHRTVIAGIFLLALFFYIVAREVARLRCLCTSLMCVGPAVL